MTDALHEERILVLDFGSQYTQLIARVVRELGVYCEILPFDCEGAEIAALKPRGIILSGGPESVTAADTPRITDAVLRQQVPVLGICYGMQALAQQLGGEVETSNEREYGHAVVNFEPCRLFAGLPEGAGDRGIDVWMSHGDRVARAPEGFHSVASSTNAPLAAIADESRDLYGLQFHPEVTHTAHGRDILKTFLGDICGLGLTWTPGNIVDSLLATVREQVGAEQVLLALSGGVDSSVLAALLHRAVGDQLTCIFVDTGLLRKNEGDQVMATFAEHLGVHVIRVDARDRYLTALEGVDDPERKRKIIGQLFIEIFEEQAAALSDVRWLAQGTIYPDVIESAGSRTGKAHVIKSHHNVGGLPDVMNLKLLEPLRELFKDEVRAIGEALGLPHRMVYRHPFPGPGLAVRILGEVKGEYAEILTEADAIFLEELEAADLYDQASQAFAVFLPVKSVGVVGDGRSYDHVIALRAVQTVDFMTAHWMHLPHEFLARVSNRIINEVRGVSRVTYDISSKPPATIEWE